MLIGAFLIVVAIVAFTYQGVTYTTREKVVDMGPVQITSEKKNTIPLTPLVGVLALVCGTLLVVVGRKNL
jgi:uncharacterized membrane protein YidH (DUF202 family)